MSWQKDGDYVIDTWEEAGSWAGATMEFSHIPDISYNKWYTGTAWFAIGAAVTTSAPYSFNAEVPTTDTIILSSLLALAVALGVIVGSFALFLRPTTSGMGGMGRGIIGCIVSVAVGLFAFILVQRLVVAFLE